MRQFGQRFAVRFCVGFWLWVWFGYSSAPRFSIFLILSIQSCLDSVIDKSFQLCVIPLWYQ
ncbi:hypothetical protein HanIR_Chr10g0476861 [Helianthus annuus]|nr:hypothetical protein HanIR_Chr10g0476861 [Helianthus annuus]